MHTVLDWISNWIKRMLPNRQAVSFIVLLTLGFVVIITLSDMFMPVYAAGVIAYLLDGSVSYCVRHRLPRTLAVVVVFFLFVAFGLFMVIALLPVLYQQSASLIEQMPAWLKSVQVMFTQLPQRYPNYVTRQQLDQISSVLGQEWLAFGQSILSYSYSSIVNIITVIVYVVMVPLLIFFFLKDKDSLLAWLNRYLPEDRYLLNRVWAEVDIQICNYVRGKLIEVLILFSATFLAFTLLDLHYGLLLSVLTGMSVIIPYIGTVLVIIPVVLVAYFQWGISPDFWTLIMVYAIIHMLDSALLVTMLFSEVVNLHPIAIVVAILFFGGMWGFWGVFFAIPLATLVKAILNSWPKLDGREDNRTGIC
ncbi:MAG: AI-2E family transporter [Methylococcaceae bacterium]